MCMTLRRPHPGHGRCCTFASYGCRTDVGCVSLSNSRQRKETQGGTKGLKGLKGVKGLKGLKALVAGLPHVENDLGGRH